MGVGGPGIPPGEDPVPIDPTPREYDETVTCYLALNGRYLAKIVRGNSDPAQTYYLHTDMVGSVRAITDSAGMAVASFEYEPFGLLTKSLSAIDDAAHRFTGKPEDEVTELYYFGARYYDPAVGRFISRDPARQGLNWYTYALNDPLGKVDSNGFYATEATYSYYDRSVTAARRSQTLSFDDFASKQTWVEFVMEQKRGPRMKEDLSELCGISTGILGALGEISPPTMIGLLAAEGIGYLCASRQSRHLDDIDGYIRGDVPLYLLDVSYGYYRISEISGADGSMRVESIEVGSVDMYYVVFDLQTGPKTYELSSGEFGALQAASGSPVLHNVGQTPNHKFTRC